MTTISTTTAAAEARVTVATIRDWARRGIIAATKVAGRWVIDTTSLAHRIAIGAMKRRPAVVADLTGAYLDCVVDMTGFSAGNRAALRQILAAVKARNIAAALGDVDPRRVYLTDTQWAQLEKSVSFQVGCTIAEY